MYRSQSGRIVANTLTDGATQHVSRYGFDTAGRLVNAIIPGHTLNYGYRLGVAILGAIIVPILSRRPIDPDEIRRLVDYLARPAG